MGIVSKTDYMLWRECPKNAWLKIHKPEVFYASELTEFDKSIIDSGIEVEGVARGLFSGGQLILGRDIDAQRATQDALVARAPVLFQPIFEREGFLAAVDVLEWNADANSYGIYEIKSSTKPKDEHLYDIAFQVLLLRRCGLNVDRAYLIHLNSGYVRSGDFNLANLFAKVDLTQQVTEVIGNVTREIEQAHTYLGTDVEPPGACLCIYKGRSQHCSTFHYSNPHVPEYGVHDISRIGNSPKKLKEMIDAGVFSLDRIPTHIKLSEIQAAQVRAFNSGQTEIKRDEIARELATLQFPLHFIDYETFPSALPLFDGYSPYEHIPFQYSLHIAKGPDEPPAHNEYLHKSYDDPSKSFVKSLQESISPTGSIIVWSKTFEIGINNHIAQRQPATSAYLNSLNERIYDLSEIFSKQYFVHRDLHGKFSIKYVLPVLAPELDYESLEIQEGGTASITWSNIVSGQLSAEERDRLSGALRKYCGMDSYGMYAIWKALRRLATT